MYSVRRSRGDTCVYFHRDAFLDERPGVMLRQIPVVCFFGGNRFGRFDIFLYNRVLYRILCIGGDSGRGQHKSCRAQAGCRFPDFHVTFPPYPTRPVVSTLSTRKRFPNTKTIKTGIR